MSMFGYTPAHARNTVGIEDLPRPVVSVSTNDYKAASNLRCNWSLVNSAHLHRILICAGSLDFARALFLLALSTSSQLTPT